MWEKKMKFVRENILFHCQLQIHHINKKELITYIPQEALLFPKRMIVPINLMGPNHETLDEGDVVFTQTILLKFSIQRIFVDYVL